MRRAQLATLVLAACGGTGAHGHAPAPGPACPAQIDRAPAPGVAYPGWVAAWQALRADPDLFEPQVPPASEVEARARLCGDAGCPGAGPWLLEATWEDTGVMVRTDLAFARPDGTLLVYPEVGGGMAGRCVWSDEVTLTDGPSLRLHVRSEDSQMVDVRSTGDDVVPCGDVDDECMVACFSTEVSEDDRFFDPASGRELLAIHRAAAPAADAGPLLLPEEFVMATTVTVAGRAVTVTGAGCDQTLTLPDR